MPNYFIHSIRIHHLVFGILPILKERRNVVQRQIRNITNKKRTIGSIFGPSLIHIGFFRMPPIHKNHQK
jgi:hypothetical protein